MSVILHYRVVPHCRLAVKLLLAILYFPFRPRGHGRVSFILWRKNPIILALTSQCRRDFGDRDLDLLG